VFQVIDITISLYVCMYVCHYIDIHKYVRTCDYSRRESLNLVNHLTCAINRIIIMVIIIYNAVCFNGILCSSNVDLDS